jgi:hypothetical protein
MPKEEQVVDTIRVFLVNTSQQEVTYQIKDVVRDFAFSVTLEGNQRHPLQIGADPSGQGQLEISRTTKYSSIRVGQDVLI